MNILETIIQHKKKEVEELKGLISTKRLEQSIFFRSTPVSLKKYVTRKDKIGVIAEIKRQSPSAGIINETIDVEKLSISYMQAGASALSVLTDKRFFGGSSEDLRIARKFNYCPILRKDFILDEYQVIEARSMGADCILLIAACLTTETCKRLASAAKSLHLEVLLEVRNKEEIDSHTNAYVDIIGVNNRNLKNFKTDITRSEELIEFLPSELIKISESGITEADQIRKLKKLGYDGFLIGGYFMRHEDPGNICKNLIGNYNLTKR